MKKERIRDLTVGSPTKLLIAFALPIMIGNAFQEFYTMADTAVVGQGIGINALSALGSASRIIYFVTSIAQGFSHGFSILMSQYYGAKDYKKLNKSIGISVTLCVVISVIMLALFLPLAGPLLNLINTPADIFPQAQLYLIIITAGLPVVMFYNLLSCILRAFGDSRTPLYAMITAAIINIGLDLLFVMAFKWGVAGAAAATIIAQIFSVCYCFLVVRKISIIKVSREDFIPEKKMALHLFSLGSPIALQNAIIAGSGMVVQAVVNNYGILFIAGYTATNKVYGLLEIAATSFGYAITSYVGQNLGAGLVSRVKKGIRSGILISLVTSSAIGVSMLIFGKSILGMFISGTPGEVETALTYAYDYLWLMSICLPVLYMLYVYRSALMGLGNTVIPMISGFGEMAVRLLIVFTFPIFMGSGGIKFVEIGAWIIAAIILSVSYYVLIRKYKEGEKIA